MKNNQIRNVLFALICLIQWWVPIRLIQDNEKILETGTAYKFLSAPIDPIHPFVGKYIYLDYAEKEVEVDSANVWEYGQKVYVLIGKDTADFVKIHSISQIKPNNGVDYVEATINYINRDSLVRVGVHFPFDRFYMDEYKAPEADLAYAEVRADSSRVSFALVIIKDGKAVIKDVFIDDKSILEVVRERMKRNE